MYVFEIIKGIIAGIIVSLPTGPASFLTIKRTISGGFKRGMSSALGCIASDAFYGSVVIFGLSAIARFMLHRQHEIRFFGGIILLYLGIATFYKMHDSKTENGLFASKNFENFSSSFFLTVTNPIQILTFAIVFGSIGAITGMQLMSAVFIGGLLAGAIVWWLALTAILVKYAKHWNEKIIKIIERVAGIVIFATGVVVLASVFW